MLITPENLKRWLNKQKNSLSKLNIQIIDKMSDTVVDLIENYIRCNRKMNGFIIYGFPFTSYQISKVIYIYYY